jgi:hypothetical protein
MYVKLRKIESKMFNSNIKSKLIGARIAEKH